MTGDLLLHESVDPDDPRRFRRRWFSWADMLYVELVLATGRASGFRFADRAASERRPTGTRGRRARRRGSPLDVPAGQPASFLPTLAQTSREDGKIESPQLDDEEDEMTEARKEFTLDEAHRYGEEVGVDGAARRSTSSSSGSG